MAGFVATSYGPPWGGIQGTGTTASGVNLHANPKVYGVAVDPSRIPLGSKLRIWPNPFGDPNLIFTAFDTGGAIKGNRIDFYDWRGRQQQLGFGKRNVDVRVIGKGSPTAPAKAGDAKGLPGLPGSPIPGLPLPSPTDLLPGGSLITDALRSGATKALLYVLLVGGGATLATYGLYRVAASSGAAQHAAGPAGQAAVLAATKGRV